MTAKQKKIVMAAVSVIKRYLDHNYDVMSRLEDLLIAIGHEEIFDVDSIDPISDLQEKVRDVFGEEKISIGDVLSVAVNDCHYPQNLIAAIFELNAGDLRRYNTNGFTPPYVLSAFGRYFKNLKEVYGDD